MGGPNNTEHFFRELMLARTYTPALSTLGSTMTTTLTATNAARYVPMGLFVIVQLDLVFTTAGGTAEQFVVVTMPTNIRANTVVGWCPGFIIGPAGHSTNLVPGIAFKTAAGSVNTVAFGYGDGVAWQKTTGMEIAGLVIYEQDR